MKINNLVTIMNEFETSTTLVEGVRMSPSAYKSIASDSNITIGFECEFKHDEFSVGANMIEDWDDVESHPNFNQYMFDEMMTSWLHSDGYNSITWSNGDKYNLLRESGDYYSESLDELIEDHLDSVDFTRFLTDTGTSESFIDDHERELGDLIDLPTTVDADVQEFFDMYSADYADDYRSDYYEKFDIDTEDEDDISDDDIIEEFENAIWDDIQNEHSSEIRNKMIRLNSDEDNIRMLAENVDIGHWVKQNSIRDFTDWVYENYDEELDEIIRERIETDLEHNYSASDFWESESDDISDYMELDSMGGSAELVDELEEYLGVPIIYQEYHETAKNKTSWYLEPDSSTEWELISPPMPLPQARTMLKKCMEYISKHGSTDESTGLHIGVSINGKSARDYDLLKIAMILGEEHIVKQFDRSDNTFTKPQIRKLAEFIDRRNDGTNDLNLNELLKSTSFEAFKEVIIRSVFEGSSFGYSKYSGFNVDHLSQKGYIEFRMAGGDYCNKFGEIDETLLRYAYVMDIASDKKAFKKEYMTNITKFLNNVLDGDKSNENYSIIKNNFKMLKRVGFRGIAKISTPVPSKYFKGSYGHDMRFMRGQSQALNAWANEELKDLHHYDLCNAIVILCIITIVQGEENNIKHKHLLRSMASKCNFIKSNIKIAFRQIDNHHIEMDKSNLKELEIKIKKLLKIT